MKKYCSIILFFTFLYFAGNAQNIHLLDQKVLYSTEEIIQFTVSEVSDKTFIAVLQLEDSNNNIITESKFIIDEAQNLPLQIPAMLQSGTYILRIRVAKNEQISDYSAYFLPIVNTKTFKLEETGSFDLSKTIDLNKNQLSYNISTIKGNIKQTDGTEASEQIVAIQYRGESEGFQYTLSDKNGNFTFDLPLFGLIDVNIFSENNQIELLSSPYQMNSISTGIKPFPIPEEVTSKSNIQQLLKANQNKNKFEIQKAVLNYQKNILISDYVSLSTTMELYKELVPLSKTRFTKKKNYLRLLNLTNSMYHKHEPLFLIDGLLVTDFNQLLALDINEINTLYIEYTPMNRGLLSQYGRFASFGILNVRTNSYNYIPQGTVMYSWKGYEVIANQN